MNRRQFLVTCSALTASGLAISGMKYWPEAGLNNPCLSGTPDTLMQDPLMKKIWSGINPTQVWDSHAHLVGTGDSNLGAWFNPAMDSALNPVLKTQKYFYMNALCADPKQVDTSSISRLANLHLEMPVGYKSMLFAFDWFRDEHGKPIKEQSIFHIPNEYAAKVASEHAQHFEWVASIHPYRADAVDALEEAKAQGARAVKWLPSGMGIDPASHRCDAFYKKAASLKIPIITHTGRESAVQGGDQAHGNPLRIRRALDHGVQIILAHCASDGEDNDLDNGGKRVKSLTLFTRLMDTRDYQDFLFGEISALTLINHAWAIKPILERTDWHKRLLNGSDYPLPAIFPLVNTEYLHSIGLIDSEHLPFLQALKHYNPLMFDFAVKRLIHFNGVSFANSIFETRRVFDQNV